MSFWLWASHFLKKTSIRNGGALHLRVGEIRCVARATDFAGDFHLITVTKILCKVGLVKPDDFNFPRAIFKDPFSDWPFAPPRLAGLELRDCSVEDDVLIEL